MAGSDPRARYDRATADLEPPFAILDLAALRANRDDLVRRAGGTPIRLASKSIRVRSVLRDLLGQPGFGGVMAYSLAEAVWLAHHGVDDILMGYPSADRSSVRCIAADERLAAAITLMVDDLAQLRFVESVLPSRHAELRVCIDLDTSWRPLGAYVGARRSPVRTPGQAVGLAGGIADGKGFRLVGVMTYEAHIAGLSDRSAVVRWMKGRSAREIDRRRGEVLAALGSRWSLEFVNAGGTGSIELSARGLGVTEVTAGSGLFGPALFDGYRSFRPEPAAAFALPVVRRPSKQVATLFSGGYPASGPSGRSRLPVPHLPAGLRLVGSEGAGRYRPRCGVLPQRALLSVTACGSGTRRPVSCANASTPCTWWTATGSWARSPPTAARVDPLVDWGA
jgi:D-serine deaminase-like pyridoxal phosphate-dependent protein